MIRRFWISLGLSVLAIFSIVGVGFSFWTFHSVDARQDLKFNVFITETSLMGKIEVPEMPVYAVLDEGEQNVNSSITGVAFYKSGSIKIGEVTYKQACVLDPDLTITFTTHKEMTESEVNELKFGLRIRLTGTLSNYLRKTSAYYQLKTQEKAPNDTNGDYIDLKAFAQTTNFDGSTNYSQKQLADGSGRWEITFHLSTQILNSFFTYQDGKRPTTMSEFTAIKNDLEAGGSSTFIMDLWQGI